MRQESVRRVTALLGIAALVVASACTEPAAPTQPTIPGAPATDGLPKITMTGEPLVQGQLKAPAPLDDVLQDQGTPLTLPDGRTMWIFADTADIFTAPGIFLTSSAAFSEWETPNDLRFFLDAAGKPAEFLTRRPDERPTNTWEYEGVWPMGATRLPDGRILISYSKYHVTLLPSITMTFVASGLFEYRYPGFFSLQAPVAATRIADDIWTVADGPVNSPVYADGYVHFMNCTDGGCYSLRATPEAMLDKVNYEWWTGSGWSRTKADRRPMVFGKDAPGRSASVQWVPQLGAYAMTDTVLGAATTSGLLWLASRPQGPWSVPIEYPMANCGVRGCYLPNVQPQSSTATSLRIAYSSGGTWGPIIWTMDVPVRASVLQRYHHYDQAVPLGDTRTGVGMLVAGQLDHHGWRHVSVAEVDQPSNLATVIVDIEIVATEAGHVRVGPSGSFRPGEVIEHGTGTTKVRKELPVGPNNRIALTSDDVPVDVKVDLAGWSTAA
jgi:hypothetical protein